nr:zinc finger, CCHC-type [Tanacetum cinerariifolium]
MPVLVQPLSSYGMSWASRNKIVRSSTLGPASLLFSKLPFESMSGENGRWPPRITLGRLLSHARGLGFKPRRGGFPSGAKKEWGLSPKAKEGFKMLDVEEDERKFIFSYGVGEANVETKEDPKEQCMLVKGIENLKMVSDDEYDYIDDQYVSMNGTLYAMKSKHTKVLHKNISIQQGYKCDYEYAHRASIFHHPQSHKDMVPDKAISMTMMVKQALAILKVHKDMEDIKDKGCSCANTMLKEGAGGYLLFGLQVLRQQISWRSGSRTIRSQQVGIDSKGFLEFFDCPGSRQGVEDLREGAQGDREAKVFQVSNDDTVVAQRRLKDKQPEEKTNTDCLIKEQENKYQTGWKIKTGIVFDTCNQSGYNQVYISGKYVTIISFGFKKPIDMLMFFGWLASIEQGMLEPVKMCMCSAMVVGNKVTTTLAITRIIHQVLQQKVGTDFVGGTLHMLLEGSLLGDRDVKNNDKWSCIYAVESQEYQMVYTRLNIASADVGLKEGNMAKGTLNRVKIWATVSSRYCYWCLVLTVSSNNDDEIFMVVDDPNEMSKGSDETMHLVLETLQAAVKA